MRFTTVRSSLQGVWNARTQPSRWLAIVASLIIARALWGFIADPAVLTGSLMALAMLFSWLLLRGSRTIWVVLLVGNAGQLVGLLVPVGSTWHLVIDGAIIVCLLLPSSVRFVWSRRPPQARTVRLKARGAHEAVKALAFGLFFRLAAWNRGEETTFVSRHRNYKTLIWRLGIACVLLYILVGITDKLRQSSGNSLLTHIIATITWDVYVFTQLGFLVILVLAIHRRLSSPQGPSGSSHSTHK
jgi:hypothetical protein